MDYITEVPWRPSWITKFANFQTQTGQSTKEGLEKKSRKSDEY